MLPGWIDKGSYYVHDSKQGSKGWFSARDQLILTASRFEQAANGVPYSDGTPEDLAKELSGVKCKILTSTSQANIERGVRNEPLVRSWYSNMIKREIIEISVARPKFNLKIGGSPDGVIFKKEEEIEAIIEIKCCTNMYAPLLAHKSKMESGWIPPSFYHAHIWNSHYAQMQGCMAILQAQYCIYIVYCQETGQIYIEKIMRDNDYWDKLMYPKLLSFIEKHEKSIIEGRCSKVISS